MTERAPELEVEPPLTVDGLPPDSCAAAPRIERAFDHGLVDDPGGETGIDGDPVTLVLDEDHVVVGLPQQAWTFEHDYRMARHQQLGHAAGVGKMRNDLLLAEADQNGKAVNALNEGGEVPNA